MSRTGSNLHSPAPRTDPQTLAALIAQLAAQKDAWTQVAIPERIAYLQQGIAGTSAIAPRWVETACRAKGIDPDSSLAGEEWITGPMTLIRHLRLLIAALAANGQPPPLKQYQRVNGQKVAQVFPGSWMEKLLWWGFQAEVWLQPGQPASQGAIYRQKSAGRVCLVLGAGNVSSIPPLDVLYKLFVEDQVVLLKLNPVNAYLGEFLEVVFEPLIAAGFIGLVSGDGNLGRELCEHSQINTIHMTGAQQTHEAIVWGSTPEEQRSRRADHRPALSKPITAELGCITPVLVVPGPWRQGDIAFQAQHLASMVAHNASFNCTAPQVVVTAQGWEQRPAFLDQLKQELAAIPPRLAYYPGAQDRYQTFLDHYPQAQALTAAPGGTIPWTVIPDVSLITGEYVLSQEAFCGILAEVTLAAANPKDFLAQAVAFANQQLPGTLSCVVLVHPATQRRYSKDLATAIAQLRYGAIGINAWSGVIYALGVTPWGAFPGHSLENIGSGQGFVHNTYLFDHPQKSVLTAPFRIFPTPAWFANHRNLRQLGQRLTTFEAAPTWEQLPGILRAALRG